MSKNAVLFREVIFKYHPAFKRSQDLCNWAYKNPDMFNVTRLIEESFAAVGSYKFIDGSHCDFSDGTDSKTASIGVNSSGTSNTSFTGAVHSVVTSAGTLKQGGLRVIVYNPHTDSLMYYFLPKSFWSKHITMHNKKNCGLITYSYNIKKDNIKKFENFRFRSFRQLALCPYNWEI
jgi:hypothetical protein